MTLFKVPALKEPIALESIIWIEGAINYSIIHRIDARPHVVAETLKWFEQQLTGLIRVHKSALVNPIYVSLFAHEKANNAHIMLNNGVALPVSRRRITNVARRLSLPVA